MKIVITPAQKRKYEKIIEDVSVDCNGEDEQIAGWECILDENIATPCSCRIGKLSVVLEKVGTDDTDQVIIGTIRLNKTKIRVLMQDVLFDDPQAMQYINAYKQWCKHG